MIISTRIRTYELALIHRLSIKAHALKGSKKQGIANRATEIINNCSHVVSVETGKIRLTSWCPREQQSARSDPGHSSLIKSSSLPLRSLQVWFFIRTTKTNYQNSRVDFSSLNVTSRVPRRLLNQCLFSTAIIPRQIGIIITSYHCNFFRLNTHMTSVLMGINPTHPRKPKGGFS